MNDRTARWLAIATLCLLPLCWLWPSVAGPRRFVPYDLAEFPPASLQLSHDAWQATARGTNHDVTEVPVWFLPELVLARDELRSGRAPTWNPHARGGAPLHAHGLIGLCYPPNWLALFAADPEARLGWLAWLSLALGGLLALGLLRELGLPWFAAWFGAALFELSAPMATNAYFWMRLASFVWLPGVLWTLLRLARGDTLRPAALAAAAAAFAATWLGGFPPFAATTSAFALSWTLWLAAERWREQSARAALRLLLRLGAALVLGGLLALPQVLPSLQFFPLSARTPNPTAQDLAGSAFEVYGLTGYLAPDLIAHPTATHEFGYAQSALALLLNGRTDAAGKAQLPNYNYTEYAVFLGTLGLLLAIAGAIGGRGRRRGFALLAYGLAFGLALQLPGVRLLSQLPLLENVWPMRWLAPASLLLAWLAALGVERLQRDGMRLPAALGIAALLLGGLGAWACRLPAAWHTADNTWAPQRIAEHFGVSVQGVVEHVQGVPAPPFDRFALSFARAAATGTVAAIGLLLAGVLLLALARARGERTRRWLLWLGAAATLLQLALHGAPLTAGAARAHALDTPVHAFLRERAAAAAADGGVTIARASVVPTLPAQLPPGELMAAGLRDLHFYTHYDGRSAQPLAAMLGPELGPRAAAKGYLVLSLPDALLEHPLLDLLGVRYVLATERLEHAGPAVGPEFAGPRGAFFVYERPHALPRAFTVPALRVLADDQAVVAALADPALAPRTAALVTAADAPADAAAAPDAPPRTVRFRTDTPTEVELEVAAGAAPWLVLTDTFLPGWTATVDGAPVPIRRANHAFRVVPLHGEACRVRFVYAAPGLAAGFAAAVLAVATLLALALWHRRRARAAPATGTPAAHA
ncbi:MAG: hypothetical protein JNL08_14980 [Planctomycetes bacterium]|nr:hypothetical protein [Planctomycetota bacterium]